MANFYNQQPNQPMNNYQPQMQAPAMSYPVQQPSSQPFTGRYVNSQSDILPNEVPMDGRIALFPNTDLNEIFLKCWTPEGRIRTFRYILDTSCDLNAAPAQPAVQSYDQLASRIEELEKQIQRKNTRSGNMKEEGK